MAGTLPSQRQLLSDLIERLRAEHADDETAQDDAATTGEGPEAKTYSSSPVPETWDSPARKSILLTLHVVFPGMLLPALDLLDRNLVQRLTPSGQQREKDYGRQDDALPESRDMEEKAQREGQGRVYIVRSAAPTMPRRGGGEAVPVQTYLVHLDAWNCSCAGFAVDVFSGAHASSDGEACEEEAGEQSSCVFGGTSAVQVGAHGAENVPCCKHLLACVLVDEWEDLFVKHAEDRMCTREELAGVIAGI